MTKTISLLQWNIWCKQPIEAVIAAIKTWQPDIICIQECIEFQNKNTADQVADSLGFYHVYSAAQHWQNSDTKSEQGNAIFSRFPIVASKSVFVQSEREKPADGSDEGRTYLEAEIQIEDTTLTVATTHLSYSPQFEYTPKRAAEADKLAALLKDKKESFIFTGDLNSPPSSPIFETICKILKHVGPDMEQPTWPTKPFDYHGWQEDELRWRIDYAFATPDIAIESAEIISTDVSDHLPILVTASLGERLPMRE